MLVCEKWLTLSDINTLRCESSCSHCINLSVITINNIVYKTGVL